MAAWTASIWRSCESLRDFGTSISYCLEKHKSGLQELASLTTWQQSYRRMMHRFHARRAARAAVATAFKTMPEPRTIGTFARGQQLIEGRFLFSGMRVEGTDHSIWDIAEMHPEVADEVHGFGWLDDLAAVGDDDARSLALAWVSEWIARYGQGRGDGWTPEMTGHRLMRLINHGPLILRGQNKSACYPFFQSLARQALFLSRRWHATEHGVARFTALAGMIHAGLTLKSMDQYTAPALAALAEDCESQISESGAIATRKPEDLLDILSLLNWTVQSLKDAGHHCPAELTNAIARITPTLRALRHADGSLARFHGGGAGIEGRLDEALVASAVKTQPTADRHLGYARLAAGRTTLIVDADAPPTGAASAQAHASTLAFELTSGRRPVFVNCGSGARFGAEWRRASRATPSHSTMMIDGVSSAHLQQKKRSGAGLELLSELPTRVECAFSDTPKGRKLALSHNGYQPSHGLTHARTLTLSADGRELKGEDVLTCLDASDKARFDETNPPEGNAYLIRFHLHPDVTPAIDATATAVSLTLKSGEVWVLRHDGAAKLSLSASVYLQNHQLKPVATQQVVLSGSTIAYATRVRWSLAKTQDTPTAVRDFA